jgi:hypothetical protein
MALVAAFPTKGEIIYVDVNKSDEKKVAMPKERTRNTWKSP